MKQSVSPREKWFALLRGGDVGPMVSPLCDDWALDIPYRWPYPEPDPFPPGHAANGLSQQLAMAGICGWDATFLAGVPMPPRNPDVVPQTKSTPLAGGGTRFEHCIRTPYGDLTTVEEHKTTMHVVKHWLESEADYRKAGWVTRQQADYDEDAAIARGREYLAAVKDRGVLGTWFGPPAINLGSRDNWFYHLADWPDAFAELHAVTTELSLKQARTLRKAGFDYLFYCVDGAEWISPSFFRNYVTANTRKIFAEWRAAGGFILWHSCGRIKAFVEAGFYNELKPEIMETLSEPPVGNLPSLKWARERLDRAIITKGNMPLNVLLEGTPAAVRAEVRRIKAETQGYRHIVGLSDDVLRNTPLANCQAFVDESRRA